MGRYLSFEVFHVVQKTLSTVRRMSNELMFGVKVMFNEV